MRKAWSAQDGRTKVKLHPLLKSKVIDGPRGGGANSVGVVHRRFRCADPGVYPVQPADPLNDGERLQSGRTKLRSS